MRIRTKPYNPSINPQIREAIEEINDRLSKTQDVEERVRLLQERDLKNMEMSGLPFYRSYRSLFPY